MIYIWKPTSCPGQMIPRQEWKRRMLKPGVWGDEVVLTFASNIVIIPALRESSVHQGLGVQLIKSKRNQNNDPLFLFSFSEQCPLPEHLFEFWAECLEDLLPTRMTKTSYQQNWYWSIRGESSEHSSHGIFKFWEVGTFTANLISCPHPNVRGRGRGQVWRRGRDRKTYWAESEQLLSSCRWTWQVVWTFRKCCFNKNVRDCS